MQSLIHTHSEFSTTDGILSPDKLCKIAKEKGFNTVTLTDHGSMAGSVAFLNAAKKHDIRPVLGVELYFQAELERSRAAQDRSNQHLLAVALNREGYFNLVHLSSLGWDQGFYYRPRVDWDMLEKHSAGVRVSTACMGGILNPYFRMDNLLKAREVYKRLEEIYGKENVFLEIQMIEGESNKTYVKKCAELKRLYPQARLVLGQDTHFGYKEDRESFDVFKCIVNSQTWADPERWRSGSDYSFTRNEEELRLDFKRLGLHTVLPAEMLDEAIANCEAFTDGIEKIDIAHNPPVLPSLTLMGMPQKDLTKLVLQGTIDRGIGLLPNRAEYLKRMKYELGVIKDRKFDDYFLMQRTIIDLAKQIGVATGCGRGSAAGSLVNYLLGITDIDPIKHDLMFERFLNPSRKELPDIDMDYSDREAVFNALQKQFGKDKVCKIATYSTFQVRGLINDFTRVFNLPFADTAALSKKLDSIKDADIINMTVDQLIIACPELATWMRAHKQFHIEKHMRNLHGGIRHKSQHAAGTVITSEPVSHYFPVERVKDALVCAFTEGKRYNELMQIGGVKFDTLGLNTLAIHQHAVQSILARHPDFDPEILNGSKIDDTDEKTLNLFLEGNTLDIFQFEKPQAMSLLRDIKANHFNDVCAANAINRPGPLQAGFDKLYAKAKFGEVKKIHPIVDQILAETYGVMIYQEQVIKIAKELGDLTNDEAELFRKLVFKLLQHKGEVDPSDERMIKVQKIKEKWEIGALTKGMTKAQIDALWSDIAGFTEYAFNKSHCVSYSTIAFISAYLKAHYPVEWACAYLNGSSTEKRKEYIKYLLGKDINVIPPRFSDVNNSGCVVIDDNTIMLGIDSIKNTSGNVISFVQEHRELIRDFVDFYILSVIAESKVDKRSIDALIRIGFFDGLVPIVGVLEASRGRYLRFYEALSGLRAKIRKDASKEEFQNYGIIDLLRSKRDAEIRALWDKIMTEPEMAFDVYRAEMRLMQFSLHEHPVIDAVAKDGKFEQLYGRASKAGNMAILGEISKVTPKLTKGKKRYAVVELQDVMDEATYRIMVWQEQLTKMNPAEEDYGIFVIGHPDPKYNSSQLYQWVLYNEKTTKEE